ncbi:uncharacterized protein LOC122058760 [Macadamia integrifolia]|uniref:uncharacterized protein LOC122058760 n=1 Tax=Macadamia integrifolia TaxID=60698 RepID=UPI001C52D0CF|nr:uncharacterized protein LOC122058760 [Macadamia integrifolia]
MERETEMQHLKIMNEIRLKKNSIGSKSIRDPHINNVNDLKYTSLKDILPISPTKNVPNFDANGYDIAIRNQLVKQAAAAYLQSAAILSSRNQNWLVRFWRREAIRVALRSYWHDYVRDPLEACARPIYQFLTSLINRIHVVWTRTIIP